MRRNSPETFCIEARFPDATTAELAAAEAWEAGAAGVEERDEASGSTLLLVYATADTAAPVRAALEDFAGAEVGEAALVDDTNWSEEWRRGLEAILVGETLVVRPSWVPAPASQPPRADLVIDPGQAFGTGAHVSTRLVLDWVEALSSRPGGLGSTARVLDVGTGTGVLALAALALGAGSAVGFDLDPESGVAARHWAAHNGFADRFEVFVGPIEALRPEGFDWLLANLLKREMLPIAAPIAAALRPGGQAVFSGLLAREGDEVTAAFEAVGLLASDARTAVDPNGDEWISLLMTRA